MLVSVIPEAEGEVVEEREAKSKPGRRVNSCRGQGWKELGVEEENLC